MNIFVLLFGFCPTMSYVVNGFYVANNNLMTNRRSYKNVQQISAARDSFQLQFDMPPSGSGIQAAMKIDPILSVPSELVIVRYKIPFGLDVSPMKGYAVCTKDGPAGEKVNDILRFTSQWTMGLPQGDGLLTTAASFAGGLKWQCTMFDVVKAKAWEQVVQALTSNVVSRTDEIVLIFERSLEGIPPELQ